MKRADRRDRFRRGSKGRKGKKREKDIFNKVDREKIVKRACVIFLFLFFHAPKKHSQQAGVIGRALTKI